MEEAILRNMSFLEGTLFYLKKIAPNTETSEISQNFCNKHLFGNKFWDVTAESQLIK